MKLSVHDAAGKEVETIDVDDAVFGIEPNGPVVGLRTPAVCAASVARKYRASSLLCDTDGAVSV